MSDRDLFVAGGEAIDEIIGSLFRVEVEKKVLDPLSVSGFIAISSRIGKALQGKPAALQKQAVDQALASMSDVDWPNLTLEQSRKVSDLATKQLAKAGVEKIAPSVKAVIDKTSGPLMKATKESAVDKFSLGIRADFDTELDQRIGKFIVASEGMFATNQFGKLMPAQFGKQAKQIIANGLEQGFDRFEIAKQLNEKLSAFGRTPHYWQVVAASSANRARTLTQLSSYQQAGIQFSIWESVLDEQTTETCRFLHNKRFPVDGALDRFATTEQLIEDAADPQLVKQEMPWVRTGKDADGNAKLFAGTGANRIPVAGITQSAVGQKDQIGSFSNGMSVDQLMANGISQPPIHGLCRSTIVPDTTTPTISAPQPVPVTVPKPVPVPAPVSKALGRFKKLEKGVGGGVRSPLAADSSAPYLDEFSVDETEALFKTNAKILKPKAEDVRLVSNLVDGANVESLIKGGVESLAKLSARAVKFNGKFWLIDDIGHDIATAQRLFGNRRIRVKAIDLDKLKPKPKQPALVKPKKAPKPKPETPKPPDPPATATPTEDVILDQKIGDARGSNEGGFYRGRDGVERYVKFYDDAAQANGEHLANQIYRDLGLEAPDSTLFQRANGKTGYSSVLFKEGKTIADAGLTSGRAKQIMDGFVGDVMTANWDAVGTGLDNVMLLKSGKIARIDNGGSFLYRAKAGRKPVAARNAITEWQKFFDGSNPHYARVAREAGFDGPEDFIKAIKTQFASVKKLQKSAGGWSAYVRGKAPGLKGQDFDDVVEMLEQRTKLLDKQIKEALKPKPKAPVFLAKPLSDVKPKRGLKFKDLPEKEIEWHSSRTTLPSGESERAFEARWAKELSKLTAAEELGVKKFTNGRYGAIRDVEVGAARGDAELRQWSDSIKQGLSKMPKHEGTVFRAVSRIDEDVVQGMLDGSGLDKGIFRMGQGNKGATTSFTWNSSFARDWKDVTQDGISGHKIVYIAKSKNGVAVNPISVNKGEAEVMFHRDLKFKVTGLSRLRGTQKTLIMEIEEVD
jgi:SPP1 gp7 family putative phage head morphogenesis protein